MNKGKPMDKYICCPYNVAVECACTLDCNCYLCGWHPHCHARRVKALRLLAQYGLLRKKVDAMYEKLCAILDALREHGITCKAETNAYSGVWEIVCVVPIENGMKMIRVPITHKALDDSPAEYLSAFVLLQATNLALMEVLA